jgi:hypothetical protein
MTAYVALDLELLLWLEQLVIWRLQREHGSPKSAFEAEFPQDDALPVASSPKGDTNADHDRYHSAFRKSHSRFS